MCLTRILYKILKFQTKEVRYKNKRFKVYLADSYSKQMLGLMHRGSIPKNNGMLFFLNKDSRQGIWMLNMKFSIDILWLDKNGTVNDIKTNAERCTSIFNCETHYPSKESRYILELKAGVSKENGIKVGSRIYL